MSCGYGLFAEDCATVHWAEALDGRREGKQWRAPCPVCQSGRALEWDVPANSVRWRSFCATHDKAELRPVLAEMLGDCLRSTSAKRRAIDHDDLIALLLSGLQPQAKVIGGLVMAGMTLDEAMDKVGAERSNRYKIRRQLWSFDHKTAGH